MEYGKVWNMFRDSNRVYEDIFWSIRHEQWNTHALKNDFRIETERRAGYDIREINY